MSSAVASGLPYYFPRDRFLFSGFWLLWSLSLTLPPPFSFTKELFALTPLFVSRAAIASRGSANIRYYFSRLILPALLFSRFIALFTFNYRPRTSTHAACTHTLSARHVPVPSHHSCSLCSQLLAGPSKDAVSETHRPQRATAARAANRMCTAAPPLPPRLRRAAAAPTGSRAVCAFEL